MSPATHHHGPHENNPNCPPIVSMIVETMGKHVDTLEWKSLWIDHEIRALRRDVEELRTRQGKTERLIDAVIVDENFDYRYPEEISG